MFHIDLITTYLWLGLIPIIYATIGAVAQGAEGFAGLRWTGIFFTWFGYHFSMWCARYHQFTWDSFLLVPGFVDEGLLFSFLWMCAYLIGYDFYVYVASRRGVVVRSQRTHFQTPTTNGIVLTCMVVGALILFIINVGGINEVWVASYERGAGQFDTRDIAGKAVHMIKVLSAPFCMALTCYATFYIYDERNDAVKKSFGCFAIFIASLSAIHHFSRASGFLLIIFAFLSVRIKGRSALPVVILCCWLAIGLGKIGLENRADSPPGLGSFIEAAMRDTSESSKESSKLTIPAAKSNSLDALATWTRKAEARQYEYPGLWTSLKSILWNLHPFPSEIVPVKPLGTPLREIMGVAHVGLPTPGLAELYFGLSYFGAGVGLLFGICMAYFEIKSAQEGSLTAFICILLCFIAIPVGLHSPLRAMTRSVLYAFVLYFVAKEFQRQPRGERDF